jgi:hypothetical protein
MLAGILESIGVKEGDLDQELAIMMMNQKMSEDDLEFVGLIKDGCHLTQRRHKEDRGMP